MCVCACMEDAVTLHVPRNGVDDLDRTVGIRAPRGCHRLCEAKVEGHGVLDGGRDGEPVEDRLRTGVREKGAARRAIGACAKGGKQE